MKSKKICSFQNDKALKTKYFLSSTYILIIYLVVSQSNYDMLL